MHLLCHCFSVLLQAFLQTPGLGILLSRKHLHLLHDPREVFEKVLNFMQLHCPETSAEDSLIGTPEDIVSFENKLRRRQNADELKSSSSDWSYLLSTSQAELLDFEFRRCYQPFFVHVLLCIRSIMIFQTVSSPWKI